MGNYLYIIVGASATGKGVLMEQLCEDQLWQKASKYSTRSHRGTNDDIIKIGNDKLDFLENEEKRLKQELENANKNFDDALKWELVDVQNTIREERLNIINEYCGNGKGVVYFLNGNFYGIRIDDIPQKLEKNNAVVVCSDFNVISQIKESPLLEGRVKIVYIASTIDEKELLRRYKSREKIAFEGISEEVIMEIEDICSLLASAGRLRYLSKIEEIMPDLNEQWNSILPYYETIKTRITNIRLLYNRYIDNIELINCPILNFYDLNYMFKQQVNYIKADSRGIQDKKVPVFMVCAAPSSGKATLMSIVGSLGKVNEDIVITTKYATRESRPTDGRDGMISIGRNGNFEDYIKDPKDIWSWSFHNGATKYAVDISEIKKNIELGKAQIFISNMGQIEIARKLFPDNIVVLYLHATHETATKKHIKEKRKSEIVVEIQKKFGLSVDDALNFFEVNDEYRERANSLVEKDLCEIKEVHFTYSENNHLIDHVLLNTGTNNDLIEQMNKLIKFYLK